MAYRGRMQYIPLRLLMTDDNRIWGFMMYSLNPINVSGKALKTPFKAMSLRTLIEYVNNYPYDVANFEIQGGSLGLTGISTSYLAKYRHSDPTIRVSLGIPLLVRREAYNEYKIINEEGNLVHASLAEIKPWIAEDRIVALNKNELWQSLMTDFNYHFDIDKNIQNTLQMSQIGDIDSFDYTTTDGWNDKVNSRNLNIEGIIHRGIPTPILRASEHTCSVMLEIEGDNCKTQTLDFRALKGSQVKDFKIFISGNSHIENILLPTEDPIQSARIKIEDAANFKNISGLEETSIKRIKVSRKYNSNMQPFMNDVEIKMAKDFKSAEFIGVSGMETLFVSNPEDVYVEMTNTYSRRSDFRICDCPDLKILNLSEVNFDGCSESVVLRCQSLEHAELKVGCPYKEVMPNVRSSLIYDCYSLREVIFDLRDLQLKPYNEMSGTAYWISECPNIKAAQLCGDVWISRTPEAELALQKLRDRGSYDGRLPLSDYPVGQVINQTNVDLDDLISPGYLKLCKMVCSDRELLALSQVARLKYDAKTDELIILGVIDNTEAKYGVIERNPDMIVESNVKSYMQHNVLWVPPRVNVIQNTSRNLERVIFNGPIRIAGQGAFAESRLRDVENSEYITELSKGAFMYCASLTNFKVGDKIEKIPDDCFKYCVSLRTFEVGPALRTIGDYAFIGCYQLRMSGPTENVKCTKKSFLDANYIESLTISELAEYSKDVAPIRFGKLNIDGEMIDPQLCTFYKFSGIEWVRRVSKCHDNWSIEDPKAKISAYRVAERILGSKDALDLKDLCEVFGKDNFTRDMLDWAIIRKRVKSVKEIAQAHSKVQATFVLLYYNKVLKRYKQKFEKQRIPMDVPNFGLK